jgi:hypothetical protein
MEILYGMKFRFMGKKRYKAIHMQLSRFLKADAVAVDVRKSWRQRFNAVVSRCMADRDPEDLRYNFPMRLLVSLLTNHSFRHRF